MVGRPEEQCPGRLRFACSSRTGRDSHPGVGRDLRPGQCAHDGHERILAGRERRAVEVEENILLGETKIGAAEEFSARRDRHERRGDETPVGRGRHILERLAGFAFQVQVQLHAGLRRGQVGGVERSAELHEFERAVRSLELSLDSAFECDVFDQHAHRLRRGKVAVSKKAGDQNDQAQSRREPRQQGFAWWQRIRGRRLGLVRGRHRAHHLGDHFLLPLLSAQMGFDLGTGGAFSQTFAREFNQLRMVHGP